MKLKDQHIFVTGGAEEISLNSREANRPNEKRNLQINRSVAL